MESVELAESWRMVLFLNNFWRNTVAGLKLTLWGLGLVHGFHKRATCVVLLFFTLVKSLFLVLCCSLQHRRGGL